MSRDRALVVHAVVFELVLTTLTSPDLCADVYVDSSGAPYTDAIGQTWSRFCEWTGPSAPVLDYDVCCSFNRGRVAMVRMSTGPHPEARQGEYFGRHATNVLRALFTEIDAMGAESGAQAEADSTA